MKEILKEFPILKSECSNLLSLYRFPIPMKPMNLNEVKIKPVSKFTEVVISLPNKNVSALKEKTLNMNNLVYRAFPNNVQTMFFAKLEDGKILLYKFQNVYLFQPYHFYYQYDYTPSKLKKAESREEFEHRMKSINYKLKNVDIEEFKHLNIEESKFIPKAPTDSALNAALQSNLNLTVNFKKLEEMIKRTKIVNMKVLVDIFNNENAVKSTLFKMTDQLCGRFVLKNIFYEKSLHEMRDRIIQIFRENTTVDIKSTKFLGNEKWLVEELSDLKDGFYNLKGFKEHVEFDNNSIRVANLSCIKDLLQKQRILTSTHISEKLSIDESVVVDLISKDGGFFHLSNNSYTLDDDKNVLNEMFRILIDKKSFELPELISKLDQNSVKFDELSLVDEIKRYCTQRGGKFYLKNIRTE